MNHNISTRLNLWFPNFVGNGPQLCWKRPHLVCKAEHPRSPECRGWSDNGIHSVSPQRLPCPRLVPTRHKRWRPACGCRHAMSSARYFMKNTMESGNSLDRLSTCFAACAPHPVSRRPAKTRNKSPLRREPPNRIYAQREKKSEDTAGFWIKKFLLRVCI